MAVTLGVATVFGLALASQIVLISTSFGRPVPWTAAIASGMADSWIWALLVPPVFAIARRFPLNDRRWPLHAAVHLVAALVVGTVYATAQTAVSEWLLPESIQLGRYFRGPRPGPGGPGPGPGHEHGPPEAGMGAGADEGGPGPRDHPGGPQGPPGGGRFGGRPGEGGRERFRPGPPGFGDQVKFQLWTRWHTHLLTYAIIAGVWHWLAQQQRLGERDRQARELSRQLAEARLQALRMQLNPHFLFNTLNAIATLVHRAPRAADEMIACLSDFLRLTLSAGSAPENSLRTELEFARRYLEIEKARFGDRLAVVEDIAPEALDGQVPTLVLQPLLENAIRHGIERCEGRGEIRLAARRDGETLRLEIADTGPGLNAATSSAGSGPGSGIGLANTRARLHELHGDTAALSLADRPGGGLIVEIRLPWRAAAG